MDTGMILSIIYCATLLGIIVVSMRFEVQHWLIGKIYDIDMATRQAAQSALMLQGAEKKAKELIYFALYVYGFVWGFIYSDSVLYSAIALGGTWGMSKLSSRIPGKDMRQLHTLITIILGFTTIFFALH